MFHSTKGWGEGKKVMAKMPFILDYNKQKEMEHEEACRSALLHHTEELEPQIANHLGQGPCLF